MSAYVIADVEITDPDGFMEYARAVPATIAAYGGRYHVRGGESAVLEGEWTPHRIVVLEFPDGDALRAWYDSPEYAPLLAIRQRSANTQLISVAGIDG